MRTIQIERKEWSAEKTARTLRVALHEANATRQWLTAADVATMTGVPFHLATPGLLLLAGSARASLDSNAAGELLYWFDDLSEDVFETVRHPVVRYAGRHLARVATTTLRIATGFGAASLLGLTMFFLTAFVASVPVVGPTLAGPLMFVAMALLLPWLIVPVLGLMANLVVSQPSALDMFGAIMLVTPLAVLFIAGLGILGRWYNALFNTLVPWLGALSNFGGRDRAELEDEAAFTQLAHANRGRVTLGDLMVLFGWTRDEAFKQATRLAVDYDGDVEVEDSGQIVFRFPALADATDVERPAPIWERERSPLERLGERGRRAGPLALAFWLFALFGVTRSAPLLDAPWLLELTARAPQLLNIMVFGVIGAIPLLVMVRALMIRLNTKRYAQRQRSFAALREIFEHGGTLRVAPRSVDNATVTAFEGEVVLTDETDATVELRFPELAAAAASWAP